MNRFILLYCFLFLLTSRYCYSQKSESTVPYSITSKLQLVNEFVQMSAFDKTGLLEEDKNNLLNGLKTRRFAKMFDVDLNPFNSGTWETTDDGRVWRLGIRSIDAYSIYLVFSEFNLNQGSRLFVYNEGISNFAGAFTNVNNNQYNILSVAPIPGEALIIELDVPAGMDDFGSLILGKIGHDYVNEFGKGKFKSGPSESCNVDINCLMGAAWQNEKRAVCKIIVNGELCTGTLINNGGNKILPYFLTAEHCIGDQSAAESALFIFNYEQPYCDANSDVKTRTLSGATLLATTTKLDFALIKLNQFPPIMYRPYFVGWDNSTTPPSSGVCIHHPIGDVKKISLEIHPLITADFGGDYGFDKNSHWLVQHWEVGATQGGSSGSPVFNNAHRLCGNLSGGLADCSNPNKDYFSKLSRAWADYPKPENQLQVWLDPNKLNLTTLNGIDPYGFTDSQCDTFSNVAKSETLDLTHAKLSWGWISGHNSSGYTRFAEKFSVIDSLQVPGIYLNVAKAYNTNIFSNITIKIWNGSTVPTTEKYSKSIFIQDLQPNALNFIDFDSLLTLKGSFFIGYTISYTSPVDTFAVYHAINRGSTGSSSMMIYNGSWHNIIDVTSPKIYTSLAIGIPGCKGLDPSLKVPEVSKRSLTIYPNPCFDYATVEFPYQIDHMKVECVDMMGKYTNLRHESFDEGIHLDLSNLKSGIYTLILTMKNNQWIGRFVVLQK
jgi:lysyl endopeptidase